LDRGLVPETHQLRDRLLADGLHGVIYPSFMSPGGTCVALWRWNGNGAPRLDVVDPEHRLPETPASWL
jgi:RES domain-containing protein